MVRPCHHQLVRLHPLSTSRSRSPGFAASTQITRESPVPTARRRAGPTHAAAAIGCGENPHADQQGESRRFRNGGHGGSTAADVPYCRQTQRPRADVTETERQVGGAADLERVSKADRRIRSQRTVVKQICLVEDRR